MGIVVTHNFVSPVPDQANPGEVGPDEWNDAHSVVADTGTALGATVYGAAAGADTITAAPAGTPAFHYFQAAAANTGAVTLNGVPIVDQAGDPLVAGALQPGIWYQLLDPDDSGTEYILIGSGAVT